MFRFDWVNWGFCIMWYLIWAFILRSIACQQSLINLKCVKRRNKAVKKVYEINYWSILFICLARAYLKHSRTFRTRTFFIRRLFQTHCDRAAVLLIKHVCISFHTWLINFFSWRGSRLSGLSNKWTWAALKINLQQLPLAFGWRTSPFAFVIWRAWIFHTAILSVFSR